MKHVCLDFRSASPEEIFTFFHYAIVPRPVCLVSTRSSAGRNNVAPFSYLAPASSQGHLMLTALVRQDGSEKDTLRNIRETAEFVVNSVTQEIVERANACGAAVPPEVDEFVLSGLTPLPSLQVRAPRVAEAPVQIECVLDRLVSVGDGKAGSATIIIGKAICGHIAPAIYIGKGKLDLVRVEPIGRIGVDEYFAVQRNDVFTIARPETEDTKG